MVHMTLQIFDITVEAYVGLRSSAMDVHVLPDKRFFQERVECSIFQKLQVLWRLFDRDASSSTTGPEAAQGCAWKTDASWLRTRS